MRQRPKMRERPKSLLGFFRSVIYGESSPKFQMYNEQKANGALTWENQNANNKSAEKAWKHYKSETSTHSHLEKEIERGCEEEREGSPIPIFSPLKFRILRIFHNSMGFCSQVSALWGKCGLTSLKLWPTIIWRRKLREVMRKRGKFPCNHISTPKVQNCEIVDWLNEVLPWSF